MSCIFSKIKSKYPKQEVHAAFHKGLSVHLEPEGPLGWPQARPYNK